MEALLLENRERGWVELPTTCPSHIAKLIGEKRSAMLTRRQNANAAPAAPVAPARISDADRAALASRLNNAIRLF